MFRLLSSHLQALKEYRSNLQGSQVHCGIPNAYIACKHWGSHSAYIVCKQWGSHSALDYLVNWICILWGLEDDSIRVETCSPCIYRCRYTNKLLC